MASLAAAIVSANRIMQCMGPVSDGTRTTIVKRQCEIVLAHITGTNDSVFVEADIVEALSNSVSPANEKSRLLEAVAMSMSGSGSVAGDQKFQNYTSLIHFIPRALVPHVGGPHFMLMFCKFLAEQLHLRKPSEFTYKEMAIIVSLAEVGPEKAMQKTVDERAYTLRSTKDAFRSAAAGLDTPSTWIWTLPQSPAELQQLYPTVYAAGFPEFPPVPLDIDKLVLDHLRGSQRCRKPRVAVVPSLPVGDGAIMRKMIMDGLQALQAGRGGGDIPIEYNIGGRNDAVANYRRQNAQFFPSAFPPSGPPLFPPSGAPSAFPPSGPPLFPPSGAPLMPELGQTSPRGLLPPFAGATEHAQPAAVPAASRRGRLPVSAVLEHINEAVTAKKDITCC